MTIRKRIYRYASYIRSALWTLCTLDEKIAKLDTQLKVLTYVKDHKFTFPYEDQLITLLLPLAGYDAIQNSIVSAGQFYEQDMLKKASRYIPENAIVADCGCNIGNHSVFFAKICKAEKVISFDPQRFCASTCRENMALNGVAKQSEIICKALGRKTGRMRIEEFCPGNCGATRFVMDEHGDIPVICLDDLKLEKLDFVKIDIEGGQLDLLEGAKSTLQKYHPAIWIEMLEDNGAKTYDRTREIEGPDALLAEMGYRPTEHLAQDNFIYTYGS